ncbi:hypothetical protein SprV_0802575600 [Sparganum proliferum]
MFSANALLQSPYTITLPVDHHPVKFEIDTGSAGTLINEASLQKLPSLLPASSTFRRGSDRVVRETIEAWHTGTTSINRCVTLPAAYQALRAQLSKQMSRREPRPNMNPDMSESTADAHSVTPQPGSDEGAVVTTAVPSTSPTDEKTDSRCGVNKIARLGRQLRSMTVRTTTTNVSTPAPDVD